VTECPLFAEESLFRVGEKRVEVVLWRERRRKGRRRRESEGGSQEGRRKGRRRQGERGGRGKKRVNGPS